MVRLLALMLAAGLVAQNQDTLRDLLPQPKAPQTAEARAADRAFAAVARAKTQFKDVLPTPVDKIISAKKAKSLPVDEPPTDDERVISYGPDGQDRYNWRAAGDNDFYRVNPQK